MDVRVGDLYKGARESTSLKGSNNDAKILSLNVEGCKGLDIWAAYADFIVHHV